MNPMTKEQKIKFIKKLITLHNNKIKNIKYGHKHPGNAQYRKILDNLNRTIGKLDFDIKILLKKIDSSNFGKINKIRNLIEENQETLKKKDTCCEEYQYMYNKLNYLKFLIRVCFNPKEKQLSERFKEFIKVNNFYLELEEFQDRAKEKEKRVSNFPETYYNMKKEFKIYLENCEKEFVKINNLTIEDYINIKRKIEELKELKKSISTK